MSKVLAKVIEQGGQLQFSQTSKEKDILPLLAIVQNTSLKHLLIGSPLRPRSYIHLLYTVLAATIFHPLVFQIQDEIIGETQMEQHVIKIQLQLIDVFICMINNWQRMHGWIYKQLILKRLFLLFQSGFVYVFWAFLSQWTSIPIL